MIKHYDLIVIGAGAAGMIAAIRASRDNKRVLLLEKLSKVGAKLKATGGGRCNLTNTQEAQEFMSKFGRDGRFMQDALRVFDHKKLMEFFKDIGVRTHAPDGFRVFPTSHSSSTIISSLIEEMQRLGVEILCSQKVTKLQSSDGIICGVETSSHSFKTSNVILATGGMGYPMLGATGDGYSLASDLGHTYSDLYPAMMPLHTKESWVKNCRADTIAKVELRVDMKKYKKLKAKGDLIFTNTGIRGPVVLDFAREITPLISKYKEVPILANLTKGMNEDEILKHIKDEASKDPDLSVLQIVKTLLPDPLSREICLLASIKEDAKLKEISGKQKEKLIQTLASTPLTVIGHDGFERAMITRGGISLKEIDPKSMQSKLVKGLYFCGEVMNLDGPCGGYNLQWSFASGYLAGNLS
ncbi:MAG: NAD(P)/FAD-dependent oxidoreductase [Sulfurimonas sp.]|uniref:NAD(P)/FAD-dependent oxidoreductase n=1 Tax=Sulfurimonas sp. TaxID=2022749 RepID=UPI0025D89DE5|nr:NAD(P)/FAD-dependent oxidoreductase [Sulfurimonas sp.]MCK9491703.1 NAD(P)/FAD-dependent oxidoreductase [Sulfurimonas sp.]